MAIIEHEKAQEQAIHDTIDQQKKSLEIQEKERLRYWYMCQDYFNTHQPPISSFCFSDTTNDQMPVAISPETITDMINDVQSTVEEKIKHVH